MKAARTAQPVPPTRDALAPAQVVPCHHCGTPCPNGAIGDAGLSFCCHGCRTVYELLRDSGLDRYYELHLAPGARPDLAAPEHDRFAALDEPEVREQFLSYSDGRTARCTFSVPQVHCVACVWLLENLFRLHPGVGEVRVNVPRKQASVTFDETRVTLAGVARLLASVGYEPALHLGIGNEAGVPDRAARTLLLRLGVAGFAFANIMLLSFPAYLGLDPNDVLLRRAFGGLSVLLALPVLFFSATEYWRNAWFGLRRRIPTIDLPIAVGMAALVGQSLYEIGSGRGEGYLDSFAGLVFFLLCGKWFQRRTYDALAFDRDYRAFFPLSVMRCEPGGGERAIPVARLTTGDRLRIRHGELVPADARLLAGAGRVDYSFVTGESEPVPVAPGATIRAGGRQVGAAIEVEALRPVSDSSLAALWDHASFRKQARHASIETLTNRFSRIFTVAVISVAVAGAAYWSAVAPALAVQVFVAVLIIACPCALALAAPFAEGAALRALGRTGVFLRNAGVLEALARCDTVVFDKTGTLTARPGAPLDWEGPPLPPAEQAAVGVLTRNSTHPHAVRIQAWARMPEEEAPLEGFREVTGCGVGGNVGGIAVRLGSAAWLRAEGVPVPAATEAGPAARVHVAVDAAYRGCFVLPGAYRPELTQVVTGLRGMRQAVLSGDHDGEAGRLREWFGPETEMRFRQSPIEKLEYVKQLQEGGRKVLMVGDGLNDAGALRQSDVGVAVAEDVAAFSPACDVILAANRFGRLAVLPRQARAVLRVIYTAFAISLAYNVIGISFALRGVLSPVVSAILMPASSITVVALAAAGATYAVRRHAGRAETA